VFRRARDNFFGGGKKNNGEQRAGVGRRVRGRHGQSQSHGTRFGGQSVQSEGTVRGLLER